jgi:hypothetical protein
MRDPKSHSDEKREQIQKLLKPNLWDYNIDPVDFFNVIIGKKNRAGCFNQETALIRMLEMASHAFCLTAKSVGEVAEIFLRNLFDFSTPCFLC